MVPEPMTRSAPKPLSRKPYVRGTMIYRAGWLDGLDTRTYDILPAAPAKGVDTGPPAVSHFCDDSETLGGVQSGQGRTLEADQAPASF